MQTPFADRAEAGAALAVQVAALAPVDPVVLALPRGGVPVAVPVARALGAPLDLLLVRKIGTPGNPELAAGAVVDGAVHEAVFNPEILDGLHLSEADFADAIRDKLAEIEARRVLYLGGRAPLPLAGRTAIVVDDGIATGATVRAAILGLRRRGPARIVLAVPVAPASALAALAGEVDDIVCLHRPKPFYAVGAHYRTFDQVSDAEVAAMMQEAAGMPDAGKAP